MKVRKLYERGKALTLSIPPELVRSAGLVKGQPVAVIVFDQNLLVIIPLSRLDVAGHPEINGKRIHICQPKPAALETPSH